MTMPGPLTVIYCEAPAVTKRATVVTLSEPVKNAYTSANYKVTKFPANQAVTLDPSVKVILNDTTAIIKPTTPAPIAGDWIQIEITTPPGGTPVTTKGG